MNFKDLYKKIGVNFIEKINYILNRIILIGFDPYKTNFVSLPLDLDNKNKYDRYYIDEPMRHCTSYGLQFVDKICKNFSFKTVLDGGCGSGKVVSEFIKRGYIAKGIELSEWVVLNKAESLYKKGIIQIGSLDNLPYEDNSFDLVFSSDVLEHVREEAVEKVISELVRVCKKYIFLSISLRPSSQNNAYHVTLKPRNWWEKKIIDCGADVDTGLIEKFQKRLEGATNREVLQLGPAKELIDEMNWFIENEKYSFGGELEPWVFVFKKRE